MTTNVVSLAAFARSPRQTRTPDTAGATVVPLRVPVGTARRLLATWLAEEAAMQARSTSWRALERAEAVALKRFKAAKRSAAHPAFADKLLHDYWAALEARRSRAGDLSHPCHSTTGAALDGALACLPETLGRDLVSELTPVEAGRIGRTASALRRRRRARGVA